MKTPYCDIWLLVTALLAAEAVGQPKGTDGSISAPSALRLDLATFLGGSGEDRAHGMAVDGQGNIYLTAPIQSTDFPTTPNALNKTPTGIYFAKLSPTGAVLYSTYLGAAGGINYVHGVAVDKDGFIYLAGNTTNPDFPTTPGAFQTQFKGPSDDHHGDAFVIKLSPAGDKIIYATLLGGTGRDICGQIAVDAEGNAYVLGCTSSKDFPVTPGTFQTTFKGGEDTPTGRGDLFVAKLSADGSKLVYCTYVGGSGAEAYGSNLVLCPSGSVCFAASTVSPDFPTTANALAKSYSGGADLRSGGDAVVVKLNATGTALEYSTYVGGSGGEHGTSLAVDRDGNVWLAGETTSDDFPTTPGAICRKLKGGSDCFFVELNPTSGALLYSSLLGGSKSDSSAAIAVHASGLLILTGRTESADFPVTPGADNIALKGPADLFVALVDPVAKALRYCTFLGGSGTEVPGPLLLIGDNIYLAGNTNSADFPVTPGAGDTTYNGGTNEWGGDAFVARFTLVGKNGAPPAETK